MTLRGKFNLVLILFALFISISIFIFNFLNSTKMLKQELIERGKVLSKGLAFSSELGVLSEDRVFLEPILKGLIEEKDVIFVGVYNLNGKEIASLEKGKVDNSIPENALKRCMTCMNTSLLKKRYDFVHQINEKSHLKIENTIYDFFCPITTTSHLEENIQIIGIARVSLSPERIFQERISIIFNAVITTLVLMILGILIATIGSLRITSPLKKLKEATKAMEKGEFAHRVSIKSRDEIGSLADSFNKMAEELEKAYSEIKEYSSSLERMVEDRTRELKNAHSQLIQSAKMAVIGQIGAGVAHEINNPLTSILGFTQLLSSKLDKLNLDPETFKIFKNYLEKIEKESERCKIIVEKLLSFSRKPSEGIEIFDINKVIEDTLSLLKSQLTVSNIDVITDFKVDLPLVKGIPNQIQQVFVNMIVNAKDAMPNGGELKISTEIEDDMVKISFSDTGHGISKENLSKIFEPFFTTKHDKKSVGLGLSISYNIIREHGGDIKVESEEGKGTSFYIYLPSSKGENNGKEG